MCGLHVKSNGTGADTELTIDGKPLSKDVCASELRFSISQSYLNKANLTLELETCDVYTPHWDATLELIGPKEKQIEMLQKMLERLGIQKDMSLYQKLEEMEIIWENGDGKVSWNKIGELTNNQLELLKRIKIQEMNE